MRGGARESGGSCMRMSRRELVRAIGVGAVGAGALSACGSGGVRRGRRRPTTTNPSAKPAAEPDAQLKIGSIGASYGIAGRFERQISIGVSEAAIDANARWKGVFGQKIAVAERHVVEKAGEDLGAVIGQLAEDGVTAVISSLDDDALIAAMPAFVKAGIAVVDVFTSSMAVRAKDVQSSGLLTRLCPNDVALAAGHADAAWGGASERAGKPGTVFCVSESTTQGKSLVHEVQQVLGPAGGRVVGQHMYPIGSFGDRAAVVKKVLQTKPALVLFNGPGEDAGPFLSDLHRGTLDKDGRPTFDVTVRVATPAVVDYVDAQLAPECMAKATGTEPGGELTSDHVNMMLNVDPNLLRDGYAYSQQAYDAVMMIALAAYDALSVEGTEIAASMPRILTGSSACTDFGACRTLMRDGLTDGKRETITYQGRMGQLVLDPQKDPSKGQLRGYKWDKSNALQASGNAQGFEVPG